MTTIFHHDVHRMCHKKFSRADMHQMERYEVFLRSRHQGEMYRTVKMTRSMNDSNCLKLIDSLITFIQFSEPVVHNRPKTKLLLFIGVFFSSRNNTLFRQRMQNKKEKNEKRVSVKEVHDRFKVVFICLRTYDNYLIKLSSSQVHCQSWYI